MYIYIFFYYDRYIVYLNHTTHTFNNIFKQIIFILYIHYIFLNKVRFEYIIINMYINVYYICIMQYNFNI